MADKELDLKNLVDGVVKILADNVASPPWQVRRETGAWPQQRSAELVLLDQQLADERSVSEAKVDSRYAERRKDIGKVVEERGRRIDAYAGRTRQVISAEDNKFIVAGRVTDQETGIGLPNVRVHAFDLDRRQDDKLGRARTDSLGYFRIEYTAADFMDAGEESKPETFIEVLGDDDEVIHTSRQSFVQKAGDAEFVKVELDGSSMEKNLNAGLRIDSSIRKRVDGLEIRKRLLTAGNTGLVRKTPPRKTTDGGVTRRKTSTAKGKTSPAGGGTKARARVSARTATKTATKAARKAPTKAATQTASKARKKTTTQAKAGKAVRTKAQTKAQTKTQAKAQTKAKTKRSATAAGKSKPGRKTPPKAPSGKRTPTAKSGTRKRTP